MTKYVIKRLLWMIPVAIGVAVVIFTILYFTPGDPAVMILGSSATFEDREALRETMGLNDGYIVQLFRFLKDTFINFDLGTWQHYVIPVIATSLAGIATQARLVRSSMLEVIRSDYVTTARAKGVSKFSAVYRHALPNALIPVITQVGTSFGKTLGGTIVIESVFSIPGIGNYMISAVNNRDYPVVRGSVVFLAVAFSFVVLLVDIIYAYVDPRIKAQYEGKSRRKKNG